MPLNTLEELLNNNSDILNYYQNAKLLWDEILNNTNDINNTNEIAQELNKNQLTFESRCGGRSIGQEIMVYSGFARLYDTASGFSKENKALAKRIINAFEKSTCSVEVKYTAKKAAEVYGLLSN